MLGFFSSIGVSLAGRLVETSFEGGNGLFPPRFRKNFKGFIFSVGECMGLFAFSISS